jgi:hypothetical protein
MTRYLSAEDMDMDDFGDAFTLKEGEIVYDAKTVHGPWATMTEASFKTHGTGQLGTGKGQKYKRNERGELHKVEG